MANRAVNAGEGPAKVQRIASISLANPVRGTVDGTGRIFLSRRYAAFVFVLRDNTPLSIGATPEIFAAFGKVDAACLGESAQGQVPSEALDIIRCPVVDLCPNGEDPEVYGVDTIYLFSGGTAVGTLDIYAVDGRPVAYRDDSRLAFLISQALNAPATAQRLAWGPSTAVAMGAVSATILAANTLRRAWRIQNTGMVPVYVRFAAVAATVANDQELSPGETWSESAPTPATNTEIRGITAGAAGVVRVMEAL